MSVPAYEFGGNAATADGVKLKLIVCVVVPVFATAPGFVPILNCATTAQSFPVEPGTVNTVVPTVKEAWLVQGVATAVPTAVKKAVVGSEPELPVNAEVVEKYANVARALWPGATDHDVVIERADEATPAVENEMLATLVETVNDSATFNVSETVETPLLMFAA